MFQDKELPPQFSARGFLLEGAVAHATRGRDGRQEGRERGYYYLHRNLNDPLLHNYSLLIIHYSLFISLALWRWSSNISGTDPSAFYLSNDGGLIPRCSELLWPLILIKVSTAISTAATARIDHEARSLSGHCEATGVNTLALGQLDL